MFLVANKVGRKKPMFIEMLLIGLVFMLNSVLANSDNPNLDHDISSNITGTVVDKESKEPIREFILLRGEATKTGDIIDINLHSRQTFRGGEYSTAFNPEKRHAHFIRIEAEGYKPFDSKIFMSNEVIKELDFELKKCNPITGQVMSQENKPIKDARVIYFSRTQRATVENNGYDPRGTRHFLTDKNGSFTMAPQGEDFALLVLSQEGVGWIDVPESTSNIKIKINKWGKVQGELFRGDRLLPNESIQVDCYFPKEITQYKFHYTLTTKTDEDGAFLLDCVLPNFAKIIHSVKQNDYYTNSHDQVIKLKPSKTSKVTIGNGEYNISGKIEIPVPLEELIQKDIAKVKMHIRTHKEKNSLSIMDVLLQKDKQFWAWKNYHNFAPSIFKNGVFKFEGMEAGRYVLELYIIRKETGQYLSRYKYPFVIPKSNKDKNFEIGTHKIEYGKTLVGERAPALDIEALDGSRITLSELKGKRVLLIFWASYCSPCLAEIPKLKDIYNHYKDNDRFVMISVSFDFSKEAAEKIIADKDIKWRQGFLGSQVKAISEKYGINNKGIPAVFLIDENGIVVNEYMSQEELESIPSRPSNSHLKIVQ